MAKKTVFNKLWLDCNLNPQFVDWLGEVTNSPGQAYCKVCKVAFSLSNMGRQALVSHASSSKHKKYVESVGGATQLSLATFVCKPTVANPHTTCMQDETAPTAVTPANDNLTGDVITVAEDRNTQSAAESMQSYQSQHKMTGFVRGDDVTKAEVL